MVSLHLPLCNEPPEMVRETLNALAALDYPNLEVLVIDNNTHDPGLWKPVADLCQILGDRASTSITSTRSRASRPAR